ncbi:hypothetical protein SEVIR_9G305101v4 [Setaria viridis]
MAASGDAAAAYLRLLGGRRRHPSVHRFTLIRRTPAASARQCYMRLRRRCLPLPSVRMQRCWPLQGSAVATPAACSSITAAATGGGCTWHTAAATGMCPRHAPATARGICLTTTIADVPRP